MGRKERLRRRQHWRRGLVEYRYSISEKGVFEAHKSSGNSVILWRVIKNKAGECFTRAEGIGVRDGTIVIVKIRKTKEGLEEGLQMSTVRFLWKTHVNRVAVEAYSDRAEETPLARCQECWGHQGAPLEIGTVCGDILDNLVNKLWTQAHHDKAKGQNAEESQGLRLDEELEARQYIPGRRCADVGVHGSDDGGGVKCRCAYCRWFIIHCRTDAAEVSRLLHTIAAAV
ncbi:hypothetical protein C8J57DRAFT_1236988 [Mycena rebaudengoi]|nr:hypothetical protein C8J57DRAFT_1236988 [Mycena rebaudengoi]